MKKLYIIGGAWLVAATAFTIYAYKNLRKKKYTLNDLENNRSFKLEVNSIGVSNMPDDNTKLAYMKYMRILNGLEG